MKIGANKFQSAVFQIWMFGLLLLCASQVNAGEKISNDKIVQQPFSQLFEAYIDSIISVLSLDEKISLLSGNSLFTTPGIERLGLKDLHYTDGSYGIGPEFAPHKWEYLTQSTDSGTYFPTGSALAATWNPTLAGIYGRAIAEEAKARGKNVLLAPGVNIARTPLCGRNYEYLSEDPLLNSKLVVDYIKGVQSCGIAACVKHFCCNNQETNRFTISVEADQRTLHEIYFPAFKAAIQQGNVMSVMAAYNKFRGKYCSENGYLLNNVLKEEWGFKGVIMSDWGATHGTVDAANNGLGLEMGNIDTTYFGVNLVVAVRKKEVSESIINENVRRVLRLMFFTQQRDFKATEGISSPNHYKVAYDVAAQSIVLLKNTSSLLPIDPQKINSIAVIGENAIYKSSIGARGAIVRTKYEITPFEGLKKTFGSNVNIIYARGYKAKYTEPTKENKYIYPENNVNQQLIDEAVALVKKSDLAIVFVGTNREIESEFFDRRDLKLPFGQDELIKAVTAANPRTIVVVIAGAPVDLTQAGKSANSILFSWFNGSEGGNAIADIITGKINPSGKLPFTFPASLDQSPTVLSNAQSVYYKEGIFVGYRWYDSNDLTPAYCFGHGLSYSSFEYRDFKCVKNNDSIQFSLNVKNTGKYSGYETVQIYSALLTSKIARPPKELRCFKKVYIPAGKEVLVKLNMKISDLSYYDESVGHWNLEQGDYVFVAGSSSRDIRQKINNLVKKINNLNCRKQ